MKSALLCCLAGFIGLIPLNCSCRSDSLWVKIDTLMKQMTTKYAELESLSYFSAYNSNSKQSTIDALTMQMMMMRAELDSLFSVSPYRAKHSIFAELMGAGGIGSVNYDHRFHKNWSWRLGLGYMYWYEYRGALGTNLYVINGGQTSADSNFTGSITLPFSLSWMTDELGSPGHFECSLGVVPWFGETSVTQLYRTTDPTGRPTGVGVKQISRDVNVFLIIPASIGYRYQPPDGGLFFRLAFSTLMGGNFGLLPWLHLSIGSNFW